MTKVLLLEDENDKANAITDVINRYMNGEVKIDRVISYSKFAAILSSSRFDFVILDLMVPMRDDDDPFDITDQVIELIRASSLNAKAAYVAITQHDDLALARSREFAGLGIATVEYSDGAHWIPALEVSLQRAYRFQEHDFVIICGLQLERQVLQSTKAKIGKLFSRNGLNCLEVDIDEHTGIAVVLPRMGLVEASIATDKAIETFRPKLVLIVGICAAFEGRAKLGDILIGSPVWEHQAGKWFGNEFTLEMYQEAIPDRLDTIIQQEIERSNHFKDLKEDLKALNDPEFFESKAIVAPMVSGSAVIASKDMAAMIAEEHKRVLGLDMEMFGVYRAAKRSVDHVDFFGVKVAVDYANEHKEDRYQRHGAIVAGRVAVQLIPLILAQNGQPLK
ncbi:hypothetical protein [Mesorhizobium sp. Mes31]|uniref:5'-methylthioadenosine/S-adenosylhomocysteine nucleosidase family protein n=1 Tax=Mesorhizobium sp. Mes31 TaxID=2926017 RepID=UPI00211775C1|nr:hypothetical protein [Mesorhizobium sp. Mes31]